MPTARPIMVIMLTTKKESSIDLADQRGQPDRDEDRDERRDDRQTGRDQGAEDDDQDEERDRQADRLTRGQVLLGDRVDLLVEAGVADRHDLEAAGRRAVQDCLERVDVARSPRRDRRRA